MDGTLHIKNTFSDDVVSFLPMMRIWAINFCRNRDKADDLVQDTVLLALKNQHQFKSDTNLRSWLFILLRNTYFNYFRRPDSKLQFFDNLEAIVGSYSGGQIEAIELQEFKQAFRKLPFEQREALTLVGANGMQYDEAADIAGVAHGTMKSRVCRGRIALRELMDRGF